MGRVKIDNFDAALSKILEEYADNITEGTQKAVEEAAKVAKKEAKSGSPVGKRGKYQKGWAIKQKKTQNVQERHCKALNSLIKTKDS